ncbi:MAG: hypothetical protein ABL959_03185 [Pyrinomonadaceae bacterium]
MKNQLAKILLVLKAAAITIFVWHVVPAQQIPDGVRYKKALPEVNSAAKQLLETSLTVLPEKLDLTLFGSAVMVGPTLWDSLSDLQKDKFKKDSTPVKLMVGSAAMEGRGVRTDEQKRFLWKTVIEKLATQRYSVRPANSDEISYYWAIVPFDIEEPLFVVDAGNTKVLVNLTVKEKKIQFFWIDIVPKLKHEANGTMVVIR